MEELDPPSEQGKLWAILSYAGFFLCLPLALVPLIARDDPYALRHAKTATAVWLGAFASFVALGMVSLVFWVVTCGFGTIPLPVVFLPASWAMVVAIHGLVLSLNGAWDEPIGGFGLGERLFGSIDVKPGRRLPPTL